MGENRFTLEKYNGLPTRYNCPGCGKPHSFSRYIDTQTGSHIHPTVGRCNREVNCGYHVTPKQYFESHPDEIKNDENYTPPPTKPVAPPSFIDPELFKRSISSNEQNNLVRYFYDIFDPETVRQAINRYFIGTSKHFKGGSTVFWQIDCQGRVHAGKIMLYDPKTGKRVKEPFSHISWVHSALKIESFNLQQCFFGEHLLKDKSKPVAVVESEKTAIISSVYLPDFIWIAVGALTNLTYERAKVLQGRRVVLFPDLGGFEKWNTAAQAMKFEISDLLEKHATNEERQRGFDLADYLVRFDVAKFRKASHEIKPKHISVNQTATTLPHLPTIQHPIKSGDTANESLTPFPGSEELIKKLASFTPPPGPIRLNDHTLITDTVIFLRSGLDELRANNGNPTFQAGIERLKSFLAILN